MVVQAGAARRVIAANPDQAVEALQAIEDTGRDSLTEMRRLLGVLREDSTAASLTPQPSLDDLSALITHFTDSGLPVTLESDGEPGDLPAVVGLSAYRIVQEALTNVLKHAGSNASAVVTVRYGPDDVQIEVVDDGRGVTGSPNGGGHGLLGMRERVDVFGGDVITGPRAGGGFAVRARLPVTEAALG
jgi:signal transduction histidine kinase